MRKALVVGIDHYETQARLHGCVNDASAVQNVLERNGDGKPNFNTRLLTGTGPDEQICRSTLRGTIKELFETNSDIALLYFAGHGHIESSGGYLLASNSKSGDDGVALSDVVTWAQTSPARNRIILLDSCHSGVAGSLPTAPEVSTLSEGLTILTASTASQYASEANGHGIFTGLLIDALRGAAANLLGEITPGAVYAHIDQSLGAWSQRPVFKTNVRQFVSLRTVQPPIPLAELHKLTQLFSAPGDAFQLDPTFERERSKADEGLPPPNPTNVDIFETLQRYNRVNLLVPVDAPHMWHAAMNRKSCVLTVLGKHYWQLVKSNRI